MLTLGKPAADVITRFLADQDRLDFSYPHVGATAKSPPAGYVVDRTRVSLGQGAAVFAAAKAALQGWRHFDLGWVEAWPTHTPLQTGSVVAVLAHVGGVWWLNACRIVYTIAEEGPISRFGFAYGTLPDHAESGEERFLIEWDGEGVWYDILAFSRPRHWLTRLGYPLARCFQKRFARDSAAAMRRAVTMA